MNKMDAFHAGISSTEESRTPHNTKFPVASIFVYDIMRMSLCDDKGGRYRV